MLSPRLILQMGDGRWWNTEKFQVTLTEASLLGLEHLLNWRTCTVCLNMKWLDLYLDRWEKNVSKITSSNLSNVSGASQTWPRGLSPETVPYDLGRSWLSWLQYETIMAWLDLGTKLLLALWKCEFFFPYWLGQNNLFFKHDICCHGYSKKQHKLPISYRKWAQHSYVIFQWFVNPSTHHFLHLTLDFVVDTTATRLLKYITIN